ATFHLSYLLGVEGALADLRKGRSRNAAQGRPGLARENLDAEPQLESVLVGPDRPNRRRRVSLDQENRRLPMITGGTARLYGRRRGADLVGPHFIGPRYCGNGLRAGRFGASAR